MIDIIEDTSKLTTIQRAALDKLISRVAYCIIDAVVEAQSSGKDTVDLDVGLGELHIRLGDDELGYKFIPSTELHSAVKYAILNEHNLLEGKLETALVDRITNMYKDLL